MSEGWVDEPWPDDPRQSPHPDSDEWHDPEWRAFWLNGLTDKQLAAMSPRQKGMILPAYVGGNGYETYGEPALDIVIGSRLVEQAGIDLPAHQERHAKQMLGNVVREWLLARKTSYEFLNLRD